MSPHSLTTYCLLLISLTTLELVAQEGLFADFETSSGTFSCQLAYEEAPRTVAAFIGLATGERTWLHEPTGLIREEPFYGGLTFHRVIADFMIQTGSPNGLGNDGPGFVFRDEFHPALRHDRPGVLSMANSGPDSNGSQFFVTVAPTPWLDDRHTVFGRITTGQAIVEAIGQVDTDSNDRPLEPVYLTDVVIRRLGPAAEAFDIHAQPLPFVQPLRLGAQATDTTLMLSFSSELFVELVLAESPDLSNWTSSSYGIDLHPPLTTSLTIPIDAAGRFHSLATVRYPVSTRAPRSLRQHEIAIHFDDELGLLQLTFPESGEATYLFDGEPGVVDSYQWQQEAYRGQLAPITFSGLIPMALTLNFQDDITGTISGRAYSEPNESFAVTGLFSLRPLSE